MDENERLQKAKDSAVRMLLHIPGVHSVGIGPKYTDGQAAGELAIIVSVEKKRPAGEIRGSELIPEEIDGVKTDVVERPRQKLCTATVDDGERRRPIVGGTQIQLKWMWSTLEDTETGTMGFIGHTTGAIQGIPAGQIVGITCAHVVADPNNGSPVEHKVGQSTPAECSKCSSCCNHIVGKVLNTVDTLPDGSLLDAAAIALTPALVYFADIWDVGPVKNFHVLQPTDLNPNPPHYPVKKRGRTTGLTKGDVKTVGGTSIINGQTFNDNEIAVDPDPSTPVWDACGDVENLRSFACEGDSGSALLNAQDEVIGVVRSRNGKGQGFAVGIDVVKAGLGIEVDTASKQFDLRTVPHIPGVQASAVESVSPAFAGAPSRVERAQQEILRTETGRRYAQLVMKHQQEVRELIDRNRRVAAVWRRNGGPSIIHSAMAAIEQQDRRVVTAVDGRPLADCLRNITHILTRYGSPSLADDINRFGPPLAVFGGLSYSQALRLAGAGVI